jgi:hypothetical protein
VRQHDALNMGSKVKLLLLCALVPVCFARAIDAYIDGVVPSPSVCVVEIKIQKINSTVIFSIYIYSILNGAEFCCSTVNSTV